MSETFAKIAMAHMFWASCFCCAHKKKQLMFDITTTIKNAWAPFLLKNAQTVSDSLNQETWSRLNATKVITVHSRNLKKKAASMHFSTRHQKHWHLGVMISQSSTNLFIWCAPEMNRLLTLFHVAANVTMTQIHAEDVMSMHGNDHWHRITVPDVHVEAFHQPSCALSSTQLQCCCVVLMVMKQMLAERSSLLVCAVWQ